MELEADGRALCALSIRRPAISHCVAYTLLGRTLLLPQATLILYSAVFYSLLGNTLLFTRAYFTLHSGLYFTAQFAPAPQGLSRVEKACAGLGLADAPLLQPSATNRARSTLIVSQQMGLSCISHPRKVPHSCSTVQKCDICRSPPRARVR